MLNFKKPIQFKASGNVVEYVAHDKRSVLIRDSEGTLRSYSQDYFENVPDKSQDFADAAEILFEVTVEIVEDFVRDLKARFKK